VPNSTSTPTLTPVIAQAHERLYPRVIALLAQVEKLAARRPRDPVPEATLTVARELFGAARKILGRDAARIAGTATADLGALAVGLGQLRAGLEAFEAANSRFVPKLGRVGWNVAGEPLPVARLKPTGPQKAAPPNRDNGVEPGFRKQALQAHLRAREPPLPAGLSGRAGRAPADRADHRARCHSRSVTKLIPVLFAGLILTPPRRIGRNA
jgi:hypothetical protein